MKNIKNNCASCGKYFDNNIDNYQENGNYCSDCNARTSYIVDARIKLSSKKPSSKSFKKLDYILKQLKNRWGITEKDVLKSQQEINLILRILENKKVEA